MDPAQEFETKLLSRQTPMYEAIKRGNSAIQQFYKGTTVFITGGSGFLGKQLIEKLFRSCDIKKMYLLLRPKKGTSITDRMQILLQEAAFDCVRKMKPDFGDKIVPIEGDVGDIKLGLNNNDWNLLAEEVDIIFHVAATIRFDETLRLATLINVRGTKEALQLARKCIKLKSFIYSSTAFTHTKKENIGKEVLEQFYPPPVSPEALIDLVTSTDEKRIEGITQNLICGWPNTYGFTKALAEELVKNASDLPICVIKPPFVTSSYLEPTPGWIDVNSCTSGPIGVILGIGLGILHVFQFNKTVELSYAPVDLVNNAIIAAGWDSVERRRRSKEIPLYTITTYGSGKKWEHFSNVLRSKEARPIGCPSMIMYPWCVETSNDFVYAVAMWLFHYIPAYGIDAVMDFFKLRPKGIPTLMKIYTRIHKVSKVYKYFIWYDWILKNDQLKAMISRMSDDDRIIFNCDVNTIDHTEIILAWCVGLRRYILKDGLKGSETTRSGLKQQWLLVVTSIFFMLYYYLIWKVLYTLYSVVMLIF